MASTAPLYTIILAGGKGSRMRSRDRHKVCFEVAGVPAIVRAIDAYNLVGVIQNVVVVGEMAGQVVETVGRRVGDVVVAYQPPALRERGPARGGLPARGARERRRGTVRLPGARGGGRPRPSPGRRRRQDRRRVDAEPVARSCRPAGADLTLLVAPSGSTSDGAGRVLFRPDGSPLG